MLEEATGLKVSFKTIDRAFKRLKITPKKKLWSPETAMRRCGQRF